MDKLKHGKQTKLDNQKTWRSIPVYRNLSGSRNEQSNNNTKSNRNKKRNRYYKYFLPVIFLFGNASYAETVGGVSATAAPVANSSGSVTNQAIQVLQGPYITNTYGNGIQCQGETLNITPYVTGAGSVQRPWEPRYWDNVYDMRDMNEDGAPDNPGGVLYQVPVRTGQKNNYNLSVGVSATWSIPQDKRLQDQCKEAVDTQISLQKQLAANKRLDFEIARLKNCGELIKAGIMFHPKSKYAKICEDVIVRDKSYITPHRHSIPSPSTSGSHGFGSAAQLGAPLKKSSTLSSPSTSKSSSKPSSQSALSLSEEDRQGVLRAVQKSSQRQQFQQ